MIRNSKASFNPHRSSMPIPTTNNSMIFFHWSDLLFWPKKSWTGMWRKRLWNVPLKLGTLKIVQFFGGFHLWFSFYSRYFLRYPEKKISSKFFKNSAAICFFRQQNLVFIKLDAPDILQIFLKNSDRRSRWLHLM